MGEHADDIVGGFAEYSWWSSRSIYDAPERISLSVVIKREKERSWFVEYNEFKFWLPIKCIKIHKKDEEKINISIPYWLWKKKKEEIKAQQRKMKLVCSI